MVENTQKGCKIKQKGYALEMQNWLIKCTYQWCYQNKMLISAHIKGVM